MPSSLPTLLVHMVVGRDDASERFASQVVGECQDMSSVTVECADTRVDASRLVRAPCDVLIVTGHGYRGDAPEDWSLSGSRDAILLASDLPDRIDASFLVLDTCNVDPLFWHAKLGPDVSLAHGSQSSWPSAVFRTQCSYVRAFVLEAAAGHVDGDGHEDWTPRGLRTTWDRATSPARSFGGPDRYWTLPTRPS